MSDTQSDAQPDAQAEAQPDAQAEAQPDAQAEAQPEAPLHLLRNEEIVLDLLKSVWWTLGYYIMTLGLWTIWRKRHRIIVTNQRLAVVKGIINKSEAVVPLSRIQDVRLKTSPFFGGIVVLSSAGGTLGIQKVQQLTRANGRRLANELNDRSAAAREHGV